ncbi:hypothetical protein BN1013_02134 [Candidatus Rubidus massiliensis]|nr:hypothetical protein BN1013_02134 [Candidatus Rubidus massiliensis]
MNPFINSKVVFMSVNSMALIPYTTPKSPMEFIKSVLERELPNGSTSIEQTIPFPTFIDLTNLDRNFISEKSRSFRLNKLSFIKENFETFTQFNDPTSYYSTRNLSQISTSRRKFSGEEIAETLQKEASFTIATDKKPIVATFGCASCVALGGYDATNKIAFIVHFYNAVEVTESSGLIFSNIEKLVKEKITAPIQLHLRGGIKGMSEPIIEAIKNWMWQREDLPMEIASEDILGSFDGKSLSIDSRTGEVSDYNPMDISKSRGEYNLAYSPNPESIHLTNSSYREVSYNFGPFLPHKHLSTEEILFILERGQDEETLEKKNILEEFTFTIDLLKNIVSKNNHNHIFLKKVREWTESQINKLIKCYSSDKHFLTKELVILLIKDLSILLNRLFRSPHSFFNALKIKNIFPEPIFEIIQNVFFLMRNEPINNNWYWTKVKPRKMVELALFGMRDSKLQDPLQDKYLWKIIFCDEKTFSFFLRCRNSLIHLPRDSLSEFFNLMNLERTKENDFYQLIRNHYEFFSRSVISKLYKMALEEECLKKIKGAWHQLHIDVPDVVEVPKWIVENQELNFLLKNLYSFKNRRLYPNSLEAVMSVESEKMLETAMVLNQYNPQAYLNLLKDSECTNYALKAYINEQITLNQFVSLCLAWSVVNVYDPTVEKIKIFKSDEMAIRPFFHGDFDSKKDTIAKAIELNQQAKELSEHYVIVLELNEKDFTTNYETARLLQLIKTFGVFLFPNKNHWIIPSFTLLKNCLEALYGSDYAKPVPCLGDFSSKLLAECLQTGDRPFQISTKAAGHTLEADNFKTVSFNQIRDLDKPLINPSLWLHDLFHLDQMGNIPKHHRLWFSKLATYLKEKIHALDNLPQNREFKTALKKSFNRLVDMQFSGYKYASIEEKNAHYPKVFLKSLEFITKKNVRVKQLIEEYLKINPFF